MADLMPIYRDEGMTPGEIPRNVDLSRVDWRAVGGVLDAQAAATQQQMRLAAQQEEMRERAIRQQGFAEYEKLIAAGAKPEEALRRVAPKLYFSSPQVLPSLFEKTEPPLTMPTQITAAPVLGSDGKPIGHAVLDPRRGGIQSFVQNPQSRMSIEADYEMRDALAEANRIRSRIAAAERAATTAPLERERKAAAASIPGLQAELQAAIDRRRSFYPESQGQPKTPATSTSSSNNEKVIVEKDGKQYRLPKSQLKQAEGQGYKLVP